MIHSMTGFGDASALSDGTGYSLELRSLNNKYFKCVVRLPEELAGLEAELESAVRTRLGRGSFLLTVKLRMGEEVAASDINDQALLTYVEHLETVRAKVQADGRDHTLNIDLTQLLALPGVLKPARTAEDVLSAARPVLLELLDRAMDELVSMRVREGQGLAEELEKQLEVMDRLVEGLTERTPVVVEEYHEKLRARVGELLQRVELEVTKTDLLREVAIYADRSDVNEELQRLAAHIGQFRETLLSEDTKPAGRTLDFLAQEMLREANTIGSKSNDAAIARAVVELKSAIDRVKEQVQNVE
ncbi:MAG: YicC/YloC family endoribonuclease [Planctomycetota bacterium]